MNKERRRELRTLWKDFPVILELLDYVDGLEEAAEGAYDLLMEHLPPSDITTIKLREALAKGKD